VLLNNFRPDNDDALYFLYRFVIRSWFLFLSVIFSVPVSAIFGQSISGKQFLEMLGAFILIILVDFLSVWIKAYPIYKERERVKRETFGYKQTR